MYAVDPNQSGSASLQEAAAYWFSVSPQSRMKTLIKELSGLATGASLRFGDITEQHESLECVLNLCSQRHTHLRGHPAFGSLPASLLEARGSQVMEWV